MTDHASDSCIALYKFSYLNSPPVIANDCLLDLIRLAIHIKLHQVNL